MNTQQTYEFMSSVEFSVLLVFTCDDMQNCINGKENLIHEYFLKPANSL